jgi:proteasome lid subunit RPN8/RPN11
MTIKFEDVSPPLVLPKFEVDRETPIVKVLPKARAQVMAHLTDPSLEQGGLVIGQAWANPSSSSIAEIIIVEAIASHDCDSEATEYSLKMGTQVWVTANQRLITLGKADLRIIGWFHSHPHLSAFFSSTDRATQAAFFNHPYSVGWVIDPFAQAAHQQQAFFLGPQSIPLKYESD